MLQVKTQTVKNPRLVLDRTETCAYIKCGKTKLRELEVSRLFPPGTFFQNGARRFYFADKLDEWLSAGGELGARMRKEEGGAKIW